MPDPHGLSPLLERVRNDPARTTDPTAWNELLERLRLFARTLFLVKVRQAADASDLAQEVQARVIKGFAGFRGATVPELLGWVQSIVRSVFADYRPRRPETVPLSGVEPAEEPPSSGFDPELTDRVLRAVETLAEPGRGIVTAFYMEGQSCEEIARQLNRPAGWVRVTKYHAVRALRDRLREAT